MRILEFGHEFANEKLGEVGEFLWLNLVVVIRVNRAEHSIDILVGDGHADVITFEEVVEELAELTPVQECIVVVIVLLEVRHDLTRELLLITAESLELSESCLEFAFTEICWVDHFVCGVFVWSELI